MSNFVAGFQPHGPLRRYHIELLPTAVRGWRGTATPALRHEPLPETSPAVHPLTPVTSQRSVDFFLIIDPFFKKKQSAVVNR